MSAYATQLGMNYYHETMMRNGGHYIDRTPDQVSQDLDDIKGITDYVKLYANPMFDDNIQWVEQVAGIAKSKGMHVVVVMNTEDRNLDDGNWQEYRWRVLDAASRFNGKADEFIVGNEIKLHSGWSPQEIKDRVAPLIDEAKGRFSGPVSYEAFYWEREPWLDYHGKVYINMYEHYPLFESNLRETSARMGDRLVIGEFGELTDGGDGWPVRGEAAQADDIGRRWDMIKETPTSVAYVFTYREPSGDTGFGLVRPDGGKKQAWYRLGGSAPVQRAQEVKSWKPQPWQPMASSNSKVKDLPVSGVSVTRDETVGDCRTIGYDGGEALVCLKDGRYELSRQYGPAVQLTVGNGRLDESTGWVSFTDAAPSIDSAAGVGQLAVSASANTVRDNDDGSCRDIGYDDGSTVKICRKDAGYEMYLLSGSVTACVGANCVGPSNGFVSFG